MKQNISRKLLPTVRLSACAVAALLSMQPALSQAPARTSAAAKPTITTTPAMPRTACTALAPGDPVNVALGKSRVVTLSAPAARLITAGRSTGWAGQAVDVQDQSPGGAARNVADRTSLATNDGVADADITLLSPSEVLVIGRRAGSANMIVQDREGRCVVRDIMVTIDPETLQAKIKQILPGESRVRVTAAENAIVLTGSVSNAMVVDQVMSVATIYGDGKKVVNLMSVDAPSQVMLEVKIAEVSKSIIDKFGLDYGRAWSSGGSTNVISGIIGGRSGVFGSFNPAGSITGAATSTINAGLGSVGATVGAAGATGGTLAGVNLQKQDGIIRVLAEPNIMAVSGQSASFLSGGKLYIPVPQSGATGTSAITLEEKEFGVGLRFTPTVLDGSRINLKLVSEASELSQTGASFSTVNNVTSVLPSISTRRVDTTVQLGDGQSFVVAGLVKNNLNETLKRIPGLGEVPILGALFRSNEFQNDQTELMFVVTPRLVKPLVQAAVALPTDNHKPANRNQAVFGGALEATPADKPAEPAAAATATPSSTPARMSANPAPGTLPPSTNPALSLSAPPPAPSAQPAPAKP